MAEDRDEPEGDEEETECEEFREEEKREGRERPRERLREHVVRRRGEEHHRERRPADRLRGEALLPPEKDEGPAVDVDFEQVCSIISCCPIRGDGRWLASV